MAFLYDYFELQTWTGRQVARRDTTRLIVVSPDLSRNQYPVLYRSDRLPYNSLAVNGYYGVESESPQPPSFELAGPQTWILDNPLYRSANVSNFEKM
ncbi:hypothetical protein SeMB42_g00989 [Synchytrium endobioticum]|uniref:Uncharacterized protein n=1 Tax=Synchytrium endobioticum TaxID=286115 RepID=A0A507DNX2_9FUNG|nr:hypothetical protein SeMB42_g00989 [Synchytrium endobioticum]